MPRRILSLWLPRLASDRLLRRQAVPGPFVVVATVGAAERVHCLNAAALRLGLRRGMALTDARALCPDLITRPHDPEAQAQTLDALRRWALRYAPWVARDGDDGLMLDITGAAHLMGGEGAMAQDITARLGRAGLTAHCGLADTKGAAWALARFKATDDSPAIAAPGQSLRAVGPLPLAALRLDGDTCAALDRMGLRVVRDLTQLPRATLARRFGQQVLLRLDQALGAAAEPVAPDPLRQHFGTRLTLPEPIGLLSDLRAGLTRLLDRLCDTLARAELGARRLRLDLARVDGSAIQAEIGLARPMRDVPAILALFDRALEGIDAGFGIEQMRLTAPLTDPLPARQINAGHSTGAGNADINGAGPEGLADLLTRLGNRIGFDNLQRFLPAESHIPERSFLIASAVHADVPDCWPIGRDRPLDLFPPEPLDWTGTRPPGRFCWRKQVLTTAAVQGPERLTPEWWLDDPAWRSGLRDYWRVETTQGLRLWMFHTPQSAGWAVHGVFA